MFQVLTRIRSRPSMLKWWCMAASRRSFAGLHDFETRPEPRFVGRAQTVDVDADPVPTLPARVRPCPKETVTDQSA